MQRTIFLLYILDLRLDSDRIVDVEHQAPPSRTGQCRTNRVGPTLGCRGPDHPGALTCKLGCDGNADPARRSRDESDLVLKVHLSNSNVCSKERGSAIAELTNSRSMRRVMPTRTRPGPHSTIWVTPCRRMA